MLDIPKQRLKHLVASAILDLWKKETGSLSSVIIEGTICITSHGGRTTVVQVADRFTGLIPEGASGGRLGFEPHGKYQCIDSGYGGPVGFSQHHPCAPPHVDCHNPSVMTAYFDELSPASLVSPNADQSNCTDYSLIGRDTSRPSSGSANFDESSAEDESIAQMGSSLLGESVDTERGSTKPDNAGPVCPGTGYYTREGHSGSSSDDSDDDGMKIDESADIDSEPDREELDSEATDSAHGSCIVSPGDSPNISVKDVLSLGCMPNFGVKPKRVGVTPKRDPDALDLTHGDADLALSTPQSYTAQVRDVIRQRLLAGRHTVGAKDDVNLKPDGATLTPAVLKNLGLQRTAARRRRGFRGPYPIAVTTSELPLSPSMFTPPPMMMPPPSALIPSQFSAFMHKLMPTTNGGSLHTILTNHDGDATPPRPESPQGATDLSGKSEAESEELQKVYSCEFCSKTFLFKSKYHEHLPVHTNARPFQCHLCARTYKYKYDLRVHLRTHMGIPTKSTVCPFCSAKYDTNKLLRIHIRDNHKEQSRASEDECVPPPTTDNVPPAL